MVATTFQPRAEDRRGRLAEAGRTARNENLSGHGEPPGCVIRAKRTSSAPRSQTSSASPLPNARSSSSLMKGSALIRLNPKLPDWDRRIRGAPAASGDRGVDRGSKADDEASDCCCGRRGRDFWGARQRPTHRDGCSAPRSMASVPRPMARSSITASTAYSPTAAARPADCPATTLRGAHKRCFYSY